VSLWVNPLFLPCTKPSSYIPTIATFCPRHFFFGPFFCFVVSSCEVPPYQRSSLFFFTFELGLWTDTQMFQAVAIYNSPSQSSICPAMWTHHSRFKDFFFFHPWVFQIHPFHHLFACGPAAFPSQIMTLSPLVFSPLIPPRPPLGQLSFFSWFLPTACLPFSLFSLFPNSFKLQMDSNSSVFAPFPLLFTGTHPFPPPFPFFYPI